MSERQRTHAALDLASVSVQIHAVGIAICSQTSTAMRSSPFTGTAGAGGVTHGASRHVHRPIQGVIG